MGRFFSEVSQFLGEVVKPRVCSQVLRLTRAVGGGQGVKVWGRAVGLVSSGEQAFCSDWPVGTNSLAYHL